METYDVYYIADKPKLMKRGLTKEQMDKLWSELKWWEKLHLDIKKTPTKEENRDER